MLRRLACLSFVALVVPLVPAAAAPSPVAAAPTDEVVALVVEGVGFGHGRGLSQWGAFGWAAERGRSWQWILDHYYGGTSLGDVSPATMLKVRLMALDGQAATGVVSVSSRAVWDGTEYAALQAREVARNTYDVYGSTTLRCPGASLSGWVRIAEAQPGPVTFTTSVNSTSRPAGEVLGVCQPSGSVVHYRGSIIAVNDNAGNNRTVNHVPVESYLRGVVSREVSAGWGDAGAGAGMNALRAQAVAARSYALAHSRYGDQGGYATTCDTTSCQYYGGTGYRATPTAPLSMPSWQVCESGNRTFECANTDQAILDTAGRVRRWPSGAIALTEFSASNGPRTAGGAFPAVDDPADGVAGNPNHRWTRVIDADVLVARFGLSVLKAVSTEDDPASPYEGAWGNRIRLHTATGSATVTGAALRDAFGLPSAGVVGVGVTRDASTSRGFALVGDSVGRSVSESATSELPVLLDGVFGRTRFDASVGRCTAGCTDSGVAAAEDVPLGTALVVVELGYNDAAVDFGARIDAVMSVLRRRQVARVAWVSLSERSGRSAYVAANDALDAARSRWGELVVLDWAAASAGVAGNQRRWFASDGIHLTSTGQAEFARFVRDGIVPLVGPLPPTPMLPAGTTMRVPVLGTGGVPASGVDGVLWDVTVLAPGRAGTATVWPCGSPRPATWNVAFAARRSEPTTVLTAVDGTGAVCVSATAAAHVTIDQSGWFGGAHHGAAATRLVDTRRSGDRPPAGHVTRVPVLGVGGVPTSGVHGVVWNLTVLDPSRAGVATVWPCGTRRPRTTNVAYRRGFTESTAALAPVGASGDVCVWVGASAHVVVDQSGWLGRGFRGLRPTRLLDTRAGGGARVPAGAVTRVATAGSGGVPASGARGVVWNLIVQAPERKGTATVWPCGSGRPGTPHVVYRRNGREAGAVVAHLDASGDVCIRATTAAHLVVDQSAYFGAELRGVVPRRIADTRVPHGYTIS